MKVAKAILAGALVLAASAGARGQTAATDRILVMPFENSSGEGRIYWLRRPRPCCSPTICARSARPQSTARSA
jgi:hypothetical protein